ncbi:MAG: hypothetical protein KJ721_00425 [Nanoarchaeota archaeon]|nr:hypothetical protein [Nanoarchaeota archaeon]
MKFQIDLSGTDLLKDKSVLAISNCKGLIKGFQMNQEIINSLLNNWESGKYFCRHSKRRSGFFKAMVYSSIICCLLEFIDSLDEVELEICRDLRFHENNIRQRLNKLLRKKLKLKINSIIFKGLKGTDVDNYAYLMFKDKYNLLPTYVNLSLENIEKFLVK